MEDNALYSLKASYKIKSESVVEVRAKITWVIGVGHRSAECVSLHGK